MKKLAISSGLVAKGAAGAAAIATTTSLGVVYKDSIFGWEITNEAINEMIKDLGLPDGCKFDAEGKIKDCGSLSKDALLKINFEKGKASEAMDVSISNPTLILERTDDRKIFPDGFKLILKTNADLTMVINAETFTLKKGTNTEFKIAENGKKIVGAWTPKNISEKVGITCSNDTSCTLGEKINVWSSDSSYVIDAIVSGSNKAVTVAKDSVDHNQGFKFTVVDDISLSGGTPSINPSGGINKLTKTGKSYEIGIKEINEQKIWFLIEKGVTTG